MSSLLRKAPALAIRRRRLVAHLPALLFAPLFALHASAQDRAPAGGAKGPSAPERADAAPDRAGEDAAARGPERAPELDRPLPPGTEAALSQALTRATITAAPHLVLIRPDRPDGARRGRSGVVLAPELVVTDAANVNAFGLDDLVVEDARGGVHPARLRGRDLRLRLLLLHVPGLDVPPAPRALSPPRPGTFALALGAPLRPAGGTPTVTFGIVSTVGRFQGRAHQVDVPFDPSNAGGPLVDLEGRLLGILIEVDDRLGARSGVAFAVPPERIDPVLDRLLKGDQLEPGYLGILLPRVESPTRDGVGPDGVEVRDAVAGGPAAAAGLLAGDRIVSLDSRPTPDLRAFRLAASYLFAGQSIEVELLRDGARRKLRLQVLPLN